MFSYDNIGGKIKDGAKWIFAIEAIAAVIAGIVIIVESVGAILVGFLMIVFGPVVAWVSSWLLYGYGQLIENSDIIAEEHKRVNEKHEARVQKRIAEKQAKLREAVKATIANPDVEEDVFFDIVCPNCKAELSYPKGQLQSEDGVICPMCDTTITL